jgi:hypothetical protein
MPGASRPDSDKPELERSARPRPLFLKRSSRTASNMPSGKNTSGASMASVPEKPSGVMPTTVYSSELIVIVRPTNCGSRPAFFQALNDAIATGMRAPGRSSSMVKGRPAASFTRSVSK